MSPKANSACCICTRCIGCSSAQHGAKGTVIVWSSELHRPAVCTQALARVPSRSLRHHLRGVGGAGAGGMGGAPRHRQLTILLVSFFVDFRCSLQSRSEALPDSVQPFRHSCCWHASFQTASRTRQVGLDCRIGHIVARFSTHQVPQHASAQHAFGAALLADSGSVASHARGAFMSLVPWKRTRVWKRRAGLLLDVGAQQSLAVKHTPCCRRGCGGPSRCFAVVSRCSLHKHRL